MLHHEVHHLGVADYQGGRGLEGREGLGIFVLAAGEEEDAVVEQVAHGLDLGQDDAPFGGFFVDGDDKDHGLAGLYEVAQYGLGGAGIARNFEQAAFDGGDGHFPAAFGDGGAGDIVQAAGFEGVEQFFGGRGDVGLVDEDDERDVLFAGGGGDVVFAGAPGGGLYDEQGYVGAVEDAAGALYAQGAPSSLRSSRPAVSRKTTGPTGRSSMDFSTVSVVVPGTGEVRATSCPASMLSTLDFPTLVRPKIAICSRKDLGVVFINRGHNTYLWRQLTGPMSPHLGF